MICLDSDFIIDFLKGKTEAVSAFKDIYEDAATTEINSFEIFFGIYRKEKSENEENPAKSFFQSIEVFGAGNWGMKAAKIQSDLMNQGKTIEQNDCMIASIMLNNGCNKIITKNRKHFSRIEGIEVIDSIYSGGL